MFPTIQKDLTKPSRLTQIIVLGDAIFGSKKILKLELLVSTLWLSKTLKPGTGSLEYNIINYSHASTEQNP